MSVNHIQGVSVGEHQWMKVELVVRGDAQIGEGPVWRPETASLLWVDIAGQNVHESDPATGATMTRHLPESVGAVALTDGSDDLLLACQSGFGSLRGDEFASLATVLDRSERMNDAKCDPAGRFWAGSTAQDFSAGRGRLHVLEPGGEHRVAVTGLTLPNGLDWSLDGKIFYLADSLAHEIIAWDYDVTDGTLTDRRTFASFTGEGIPDGLTIDTDGCLWVAVWGGHRVVRLDPGGRVVRIVDLPVAQPSSCTFGGPGLDTLFVTSAAEGLPTADGSLDGSVFAITGTGAQGRPVSRFGRGGNNG
jgi:sugar lactone lactonase YvrE